MITYDPRNVGRSKRHDESVTPTPEDHAADLHAIIAEIGGPVDRFGSSGGAINGLALAIAHPEDLRVLVAHEPPAGGSLPDAEYVRAACHAVFDSYHASGFGLGMAKFIALSASRASSVLTTPRARIQIPRRSGCRRWTTARATTRS